MQNEAKKYKQRFMEHFAKNADTEVSFGGNKTEDMYIVYLSSKKTKRNTEIIINGERADNSGCDSPLAMQNAISCYTAIPDGYTVPLNDDGYKKIIEHLEGISAFRML
ncbi:MAG: hypothetical protein LBQ27_05560 [Clostridiales bacterium]|jgi:hypothetical protein|nr:hypothetical protein [Clostridiales bacterium]